MKPAFATTAVVLFALAYYGMQRSLLAPPMRAKPGSEAPLTRGGPRTPPPDDVAAAPPESSSEAARHEPGPPRDARGDDTSRALPLGASSRPAPAYEAAAAEILPLADPEDDSRETVTVRRGDTLWRISRRAYGDGGRARRIYEANRDQVADPERIYPGQVLVLP